jgi:hypothetical protein
MALLISLALRFRAGAHLHFVSKYGRPPLQRPLHEEISSLPDRLAKHQATQINQAARY